MQPVYFAEYCVRFYPCADLKSAVAVVGAGLNLPRDRLVLLDRRLEAVRRELRLVFRHSLGKRVGWRLWQGLR